MLTARWSTFACTARFLAALLLAAGCATAPPTGAPAERGLGLVIDASSSASKLYAYRWHFEETAELPRVDVVRIGDRPGCGSVRPGLGAYGGRPVAAAASLEPLLECAAALLAEGGGSRSRLHLLGTAGLRLLAADQRDEIFAAVERRLAATPFQITSARLISGAEEGVYGWIGANYGLGRLEIGSALPTVGALDLGGASTQIAFEPHHPPREHGRALELGGMRYLLYTYSYLGLGQDLVREATASPACFNAGYPIPGGYVGTGDYAACRAVIRETLAKPCARGPCSLLGVYQPPPVGDFLASTVYAYTAGFFGLEERLSPAELERAAAPFCARSWQELVDDHSAGDPGPYLARYCFAAAYVVTLLTEGFGLPFETDRVLLPPKGEAAKVSWAKGALLYELAGGGD